MSADSDNPQLAFGPKLTALTEEIDASKWQILFPWQVTEPNALAGQGLQT